MSRRSVPVIVVAGYLGSGKTTLLNHLLRSAGASGTRIGVLVNDFGSVNLDALLVSGQADGAVSLSNGCVCCSVDREGLADALATLLRPAAGIDVILIEASGIAEPKALIRMVTAVDHPRLRYGGLIYLLDSANFGAARARHPEIDGHIAIADLVVLNKADLVDVDELADLRAHVAESNPTAARIAATDSAIDPELLFDTIDRRPTAIAPRQLTLDTLLVDDHQHPHLHADYESVVFESPEPMNPRRFAQFLERPPHGCFRIKGIVHFDVPRHRQRFVVHAVGGFVRVHREPWGDEHPSTTVVAIGAGMDPDQVRRSLTAATASAGDADDEHGILTILRHLPAP